MPNPPIDAAKPPGGYFACAKINNAHAHSIAINGAMHGQKAVAGEKGASHHL